MCMECPENAYKGPPIKSIWECEACPHPEMEYNSGNVCECKNGFVRAGDSCITEAQEADLESLGFIEPNIQFKVEYNNVKEIDRDESTTIARYSDVFDYYYLQSAVGCKYNQDQQMCQVLANLCVL